MAARHLVAGCLLKIWPGGAVTNQPNAPATMRRCQEIPICSGHSGAFSAYRQRSIRRGYATPEDTRSARLAVTRADREPVAHREWCWQAAGAREAAPGMS